MQLLRLQIQIHYDISITSIAGTRTLWYFAERSGNFYSTNKTPGSSLFVSFKVFWIQFFNTVLKLFVVQTRKGLAQRRIYRYFGKHVFEQECLYPKTRSSYDQRTCRSVANVFDEGKGGFPKPPHIPGSLKSLSAHKMMGHILLVFPCDRSRKIRNFFVYLSRIG